MSTTKIIKITKKAKKLINKLKVIVKKVLVVVFVGIICLLVIKVAFADTQPLFVEVFTDAAYPVDVTTSDIVNIKYYHLDSLRKIIYQLNKQLKSVHSYQAYPLAKQLFLHSKAQIRQAYKILLLAKKYQLTQLPAIIFGHGQAVVYGVTDINQALTYYRLWRQKDA